MSDDGKPRFGQGRTAARILGKVIAAAVYLGSRVPSSVAHGLAWFGGHAEWAARRGKREVLAVNLGHAVGKPPGDRAVRRLVRREFVNEAHRSADLLWALGKPQDFLATLDVVGLEHVHEAAARRRGVVLVGVHVGGWELATTVPAALIPVPTTALVADDWLAWAIEDMRARVGLRVVFRTDPVAKIGALLRRGEALVVIGDDASGTQPRMHTVRFLDADAELPSGAVTLARLYEAALVGFHVLPIAHRRWRLVFEEPLVPDRRAEDEKLLQQLADSWTTLLREVPEHWAASFPIRWLPVQPSGESESSAIS
jgi:KDO2-lipid IV(A) lauroyltransferase